ncbi:MAG: hypothetical protein ACYS8Z_13260 [Planctomycetota bacterium]
MDEAILTNRLMDLVRNINSLDMPRAYNGSAAANDPAPALRSRRSVQDLLDSLGFSLKYLIFDLEATRRENAILRAIITKDDE